MKRAIVLACAVFLVPGAEGRGQEGRAVSIPLDPSRWILEGQASVVSYEGRKALSLDGAIAAVKDLEMSDGVVDVDVITPAARGFFGIQFRLSNDGADGEWVYLRQHKSGRPDAMQYTPVLHTGLNWQLYNGPGFTGAIEIPRNEWFHMRLEVSGSQAKLYVKDMTTPALVMADLKSGRRRGLVAFYVLTGATYFSNVEVRQTPEAPWTNPQRAMPPGTLTKWSLSQSFDAVPSDVERTLDRDRRAAIKWQEVEAEWPGIVAINRYRDSPHMVVSFATDFSKRLEPQKGMQLVYARTTIEADRDQLKRLDLGYSDEVGVFLNGQPIYRGRSAQNFRDPDFLGIMSADNDAVFLPLKKGPNELILAIAELGGGWGFNCRLADAAPR